MAESRRPWCSQPRDPREPLPLPRSRELLLAPPNGSRGGFGSTLRRRPSCSCGRSNNSICWRRTRRPSGWLPCGGWRRPDRSSGWRRHRLCGADRRAAVAVPSCAYSAPGACRSRRCVSDPSLPWPRGRTSVMQYIGRFAVFVDSCSRALGALRRPGFSGWRGGASPWSRKIKSTNILRTYVSTYQPLFVHVPATCVFRAPASFKILATSPEWFPALWRAPRPR